MLLKILETAFEMLFLDQINAKKTHLTPHASFYILRMYMPLWIIVNDYNTAITRAENYNET